MICWVYAIPRQGEWCSLCRQERGLDNPEITSHFPQDLAALVSLMLFIEIVQCMEEVEIGIREKIRGPHEPVQGVYLGECQSSQTRSNLPPGSRTKDDKIFFIIAVKWVWILGGLTSK